ncbi:MAG: helix-turn-helix transcriptional regulator [Candidatus Metalachnospira sp.]|nr:helix-turn-helix transcriptional regulator [Candidatus Metalachnospira sp.]
MAKKSLEILTETMFYVLMSLLKKELCGTEIAEFIDQKTKGRIKMGPGTLYTILAKFEEEDLIIETSIVGRKRNYRITNKGRAVYIDELERLKLCVSDGESEV